MNYALEVGGETATVTADSTLPLFGSTEASDGTAMFFTGGPVWAMDWLYTRDGLDTPTDMAGAKEQHLVLTAYRDYDEVSENLVSFQAAVYFQGLICTVAKCIKLMKSYTYAVFRSDIRA